jgi:6-phosphogluconolactonase
MGVGEGRIWDYSGFDSDGFARAKAQVRAEWPNLKRIVMGVQNPTYLAIHPSGRFLYAAEDDLSKNGRVSAFAVDQTSGHLTLLSTRPAGKASACYVSIDNTGRNLLVASFGGSLAVLPIDESGNLGDPTSIVNIPKTGTGRRSEPHPHSLNASPDNRFAIATDMGRDRIMVYRFDSARGRLTPNDDAELITTSGAGPRHLRFHPDGRFAYLIEEMGSSVTVLRWDAEKGRFAILQRVSTLPPDYRGQNATSEILVHPNGRFLYGANRGHNSIAVFEIDPASGELKALEHQPAKGRPPRGLRIDPTGKYLFASNVATNNVVQFEIDAESGRLKPTGAEWQAGFPADIQFVKKM